MPATEKRHDKLNRHKTGLARAKSLGLDPDQIQKPLVVHCEQLARAVELCVVFNSGDFCGSQSAVVP